jgi:hypothetical protein
MRCPASAMLRKAAGSRGVQQADPSFKAALDQLMPAVAHQVIQNEQQPNGWEEAMQLIGAGKRVPVLPPAPFWNLCASRWTRLENGLQFLLERGDAGSHCCSDQPLWLSVLRSLAQTGSGRWPSGPECTGDLAGRALLLACTLVLLREWFDRVLSVLPVWQQERLCCQL